MPYKDRDREREHDRTYRLKQSAHANQHRVLLEERVIQRIRKRPAHFDILSLYLNFRRDRIPLATLANTVNELIEHGVLTWAGQRKEEGQSTPRLILTNRAKEVWTPRPYQFGGKAGPKPYRTPPTDRRTD